MATEPRTYGLASMGKQVVEDPALCIEAVRPPPGWQIFQCSRKRGHGPDGEYCKQHAKRISDRAESQARWKQLYKDSKDLRIKE